MTFYLIGIDYRSTPLEVRESAYRDRRDVADYWRWVNPGRSAVLATCNRIEIYGVADNPDEYAYLLARFKYLFASQFGNAYAACGRKNVFRHGLRLACGLESQLAGEFQIMRQLEEWAGREDFPEALVKFWNEILTAAGAIRQGSGLGEDSINIADLVFDDLKKRIMPARSADVMVIGTGKVAALASARKPSYVRLAFVARKRHSGARKLAEAAGGEALLPEDMQGRLLSADAVISATSSPHYALTFGHFDKARNARTDPLYIYDLAVPRDVAPEVEGIGFNVVFKLETVIDAFIRGGGHEGSSVRDAAGFIDEVTHEYGRRNAYKNRLAS